MSITKSYNKYTDTYYAYETTYEWDEKRQKKVQRKRCIGQFDPETGEVIPNGKVGRPSVPVRVPEKTQPGEARVLPDCSAELSGLKDRCEKIEYMMSALSSEIRDLKDEINRIALSESKDNDC